MERQRVCRFTSGFLSPEDLALHRTVFPDAYSVAIVITDSVAGIDTSMFGWRQGVVEPRAFRIH